MRLKGKTALITGGSEGIGRATALLFCKEGAKVGIMARTEKNLIKVSREAKGSGEISVYPGDVSSEEDVKNVVEDFYSDFKKIDILFNNAGILEPGTVVTTTNDVWDRTIDINLKGVFLMSKYVVPIMSKHGGGSIINNSSVLGIVGMENCMAYNASKGAIRQITKSMALDHAKDNIRVNSICPGYIKTKMDVEFMGNPPDAEEQLDKIAAEMIPLVRRADAEEVAQSVLFLASDESRYMTGSDLVLDGGWTTL
ncbi:MAG: glucose 1-dehydrogenase [Candidatus Dadabacteria bacterium]|nr:glucose 1-dehydrogenase [Candidatus Dadabacteria bacterium]NIQ14871.1 glucose 1-dehydrogenase [Candidatus Dadabacteria bacterium]